MTDSQSYPVTTPLRERIALILLSRRGFGFYLDPMEGGQDAYDLTMEALDEADAIISVLPDGVAQAGKEPDTERQRELHAREIDAHIADITGQLFDALNEISRLRAGLKSIVDLQNPLPRAAVREACSEILRASPLPSTDREAGK